MSLAFSEIKPFVDWDRGGPYPNFVVSALLARDEVPRTDSYMGQLVYLKTQAIEGLIGSLLLANPTGIPWYGLPQVLVSLLGDPVTVTCSAFGGEWSGTHIETSEITIYYDTTILSPLSHITLRFPDSGYQYFYFLDLWISVYPNFRQGRTRHSP